LLLQLAGDGFGDAARIWWRTLFLALSISAVNTLCVVLAAAAGR
jgi:hypothetical protein